MTSRRITNRTPLIVAIVLLLRPVLYVGSYLALVRPTSIVFTGGGQAMTFVGPNYRFGGKFATSVFWSREQIDRKVRSEAWTFNSVP